MIQLQHLPRNPGCYLFRDSNSRIVYIGKAKNIQKRVKSYFQKTPLDPKTSVLVHSIASVDFFVTDSEVEAFILENTLIKKHQPKYNINLKDAKTYAFIQQTDEPFPRLLIARQQTDSGRFYGPFVSAVERDYILQFLTRVFKLRTCKKLPKKACLRYHMGLCCAPCLGLISEQDYTNIINQIHLILSGKSTKVIHHLLQEMCRSADEQDYEKALELRNQTTALQHLQERQKMQHPKRFNQDILNYKIHDNKVYLMLFNIYKGTLTNKNEFVFEYHPEFLEEFILQYYSENPIPSEIIIPEKFTESLTLFLRQKRNKNVRVCVPQKGEKKQLLNLIIKNIDIMFFAEEQVLEDLKKLLHLQETPAVIECFDISHLSGTFTVGSMVQFRNGKPDKSNYRRFRIRTVEGINDVSAIAEIIRRRYQRLIQEKTPLPNIIIVDGGRAQLNSALHELKQLQLNIPVVAIAKQFEELYLPEPFPVLRLNKKDKALHCIQRIRDEAHRFALSYNRLLRSKQVRT